MDRRQQLSTLLGGHIRLVDRTKAFVDQQQLEPQHRIAAERVMVLVTGPRNASIGSPPVGKVDCKIVELAADRRVQVWLPARD